MNERPSASNFDVAAARSLVGRRPEPAKVNPHRAWILGFALATVTVGLAGFWFSSSQQTTLNDAMTCVLDSGGKAGNEQDPQKKLGYFLMTSYFSGRADGAMGNRDAAFNEAKRDLSTPGREPQIASQCQEAWIRSTKRLQSGLPKA
jgi:hypothetical protein